MSSPVSSRASLAIPLADQAAGQHEQGSAARASQIGVTLIREPFTDCHDSGRSFVCDLRRRLAGSIDGAVGSPVMSHAVRMGSVTATRQLAQAARRRGGGRLDRLSPWWQ